MLISSISRALDTETEHNVIKNLKKEINDITKIIVSHRISTIEKCDLILVLNSGKVIEYGTHKKLCEINGYYKETYDKQKTKK